MTDAPQSNIPGTEPPPGYTGGAPSKDDRTMAMLAHLLAIFTGFLGPLIIWLVKKDQSAFVNDQGKEALNFQLTVLIAWIAGGILTCVTLGIGMVFLPIIWIGNLVLCILATIAANKGEAYRYPFAIRLIK
jgi:uncharacterized Tic20 family protein